MRRPRVLIVDDHAESRQVLEWVLRDEFDIIAAGDVDSALNLLRDENPQVVLLDLGAPPCVNTLENDLRLLSEVQKLGNFTKVIICAERPRSQDAIYAIHTGAYEFLVTPVDFDLLRCLIWRACWVAEPEPVAPADAGVISPQGYDEMIGASDKIREIFESISKVAAVDIPVLIIGESGTGKELTAKAIHKHSQRREGPFVAINCGAIPDSLLESELFGHEKGAFTGAWKQTRGKIEYAQGGTLFLDEVGEIPLGLQVKLLRFLEDRKIERIGGRQLIEVDTRIIAATNANLQEAMLQGKFRDDLYYRLAVVPIELPPLRERKDDALLLARIFLRRANADFSKKLRGFTSEAASAVMEYRWPGNVRELLNKVRRAAVMAQGHKVTPGDLALPFESKDARTPLSFKAARFELGANLLARALALHGGNIKEVAKELMISRPSVYYLLDKYGLRPRTRPGDSKPARSLSNS